MKVDLEVDLGGIVLRNPVLTASGTCGYGVELGQFFDVSKIGGFVAKSLTPKPRAGNPPPRIAEVSAGMLNSISLENVGVQAFIEEKLPEIPDSVTVIASVFGTEIEEYVEVCRRLTDAPKISGIELNASCPHVKSGGIEFGQHALTLARLVRLTRQSTHLPLLVKLSPNVTDIVEMARASEAEGADGVCLINAIQALDVDVKTRRPVLWNGLGGLSGPAIQSIALRMVWQCAQAIGIPICGVGGIQDGEDAVKFLLCGATAVQVGTANYINPSAAEEVLLGIEQYCELHQIQDIRSLIGALKEDRI